MQGAWVGWDKLDNVVLFPRLKDGPTAIYLVRTEPGRRDAVMRDIEAKLGNSNPGRMLRWVRPFDYFIHQSYLDDRNMAIFLVSVTSALLAITALGIFGLATFNVSTRIRQIGTRRAVGARKLDIVRHFLVENWLLTQSALGTNREDRERLLLAGGLTIRTTLDLRFQRAAAFRTATLACPAPDPFAAAAGPRSSPVARRPDSVSRLSRFRSDRISAAL